VLLESVFFTCRREHLGKIFDLLKKINAMERKKPIKKTLSLLVPVLSLVEGESRSGIVLSIKVS
jgi:predicted phosphatase